MNEENIETNVEQSTIEFRLDSIEKTLGELKSYIIETKLQQKDIDFINKSIQNLESKVEKLSERIEVMEKKPANMFENIISYALTVIVGGVIGYFLYKLGLKK